MIWAVLCAVFAVSLGVLAHSYRHAANYDRRERGWHYHRGLWLDGHEARYVLYLQQRGRKRVYVVPLSHRRGYDRYHWLMDRSDS